MTTKIVIFNSEQPSDLAKKIEKKLSNKLIKIRNIQYAITKGLFSVLMIYTEDES